MNNGGTPRTNNDAPETNNDYRDVSTRSPVENVDRSGHTGCMVYDTSCTKVYMRVVLGDVPVCAMRSKEISGS